MFKFFKKKKKSEKKEKNVTALVWNDNEVKLDNSYNYGDYEFENFTGYILCNGNKCFVENSNFVYCFKKETLIKRCVFSDSHIRKFQGVVNNGVLRCKYFENSIMNNGEVYCLESNNSVINDGKFYCSNWLRGVVNNGVIQGFTTELEWKCGVFNNGCFFKGNWREGVFNDGVFMGEWYGGKWKDGKFKGESFVGDGTFDGIEKIK